jgi:methylmalonyl-CoA mutase cobalamin-binding subunit
MVQELQSTKEWQSDRIKFVIAGNPSEDLDALRSAGIYDFIHAKSNLFETLEAYTKTLLGS